MCVCSVASALPLKALGVCEGRCCLPKHLGLVVLMLWQSHLRGFRSRALERFGRPLSGFKGFSAVWW